MSETSLPSAVTAAAPQDNREFTEVVHGGAKELDTSTSLYPSEQIGMATNMNGGYRSAVMGEITVPSELSDGTVAAADLRAAIIKFTGPDGEDSYALGGIKLDEQGTPSLNGSFVQLQRGKEFRIGRKVTKTDSTQPIIANELWPGKRYGPMTSGNHAGFTVSEDDKFYVNDMSTNGTGVHGIEVASESDADTEFTADDPTILEHLPSQNSKRIEVDVGKDQTATSLDTVHGAEPTDEKLPTIAEVEKDDSGWRLESNELSSARSNAEYSEPPATNNALEELRDTWGIAEDVSADSIVGKLDVSLEKAQELYTKIANGELQANIDQLVNAFRNSMDYGMPQFNQANIDASAQHLNELRLNLQTFYDTDLVMPHRLRNQVDHLVQNITRINTMLSMVAPQPGFMDTDAVQESYGMLLSNNPADQASQFAISLQREIEEKRIELMGYAEATKDTGEENVEQYASQFITELATSLKDKNISNDDVAGAVASVRRFIDDQIANHISYPERIERNTNAPRKAGSKENEHGESRDIVAEMTVDMLRGAFDIDRMKQDIVVGKDGRAIEGQHRAAALLTLYGKNWSKIAQSKGFTIKTI